MRPGAWCWWRRMPAGAGLSMHARLLPPPIHLPSPPAAWPGGYILRYEHGKNKNNASVVGPLPHTGMQWLLRYPGKAGSAALPLEVGGWAGGAGAAAHRRDGPAVTRPHACISSPACPPAL